jgi:release factor glutamine methyltransferase
MTVRDARTVVFRGLVLGVDTRVMTPCAEVLVDFAIRAPTAAWVHDVGTGSGALALAIKATRPDLRVSGSDVSPEAIEVAIANGRRLGLDVEFTVATGLPAGAFDVIVANLPYLSAEQLAREPAELRREPLIAMVATGLDPLALYRDVVADAPAGAVLALQHGPSLSALISEAFAVSDRLTHAGQEPLASVITIESTIQARSL